MPWNPTAQEEAQLKQSIRQKFGNNTTDETIDNLVKFLKDAKGKRQAEAIVGAVPVSTGYNIIKTLSDYKLFANLENNSIETIQTAVSPTNLATAKYGGQRLKDNHDSIEGYLATVKGRLFYSHMRGDELKLPMLEGNKQIVRVYGNIEGYLPKGGNYVEWYVKIGSDRSISKRVFTCQGNNKYIWFTDGGTHGVTTKWFRKELPEGQWTQWKFK